MAQERHIVLCFVKRLAVAPHVLRGPILRGRRNTFDLACRFRGRGSIWCARFGAPSLRGRRVPWRAGFVAGAFGERGSTIAWQGQHLVLCQGTWCYTLHRACFGALFLRGRRSADFVAGAAFGILKVLGVTLRGARNRK